MKKLRLNYRKVICGVSTADDLQIQGLNLSWFQSLF